MAIRFKNYREKNRNTRPVRAIRITEKNLQEIVDYVNRNGGHAFATKGNEDKPVRIRIKQRNFGENWGKRDWRVAKVGDFIVQEQVLPEFQPVLGKREFFRAKDDVFESTHVVIK